MNRRLISDILGVGISLAIIMFLTILLVQQEDYLLHAIPPLLAYFIFFGSILLYFLPTIIALERGLGYAKSIFYSNLFLGWTIVAWIIALIAALMPRQRPQFNLAELKKLHGRIKTFGILNIILGSLLLWRSSGLLVYAVMFLYDKQGHVLISFYILCLLLISSGILLLFKKSAVLTVGWYLSLASLLLMSLYIPFVNYVFRTTTHAFPYKAFQGMRIGYLLPFFCVPDYGGGVWNIDHGVIFYPVYFLIALFYFTRTRAKQIR